MITEAEQSYSLPSASQTASGAIQTKSEDLRTWGMNNVVQVHKPQN